MAETVLIHNTKVSTDGERTWDAAVRPDERAEKYGEMRRRDQAFADWLRPQQQEVADAIAKCSAEFVLRYYETIGETRLKACFPDFCRKRFLCSMCDAVRAGRTLRKYVDRVMHVLRQRRFQHVCYMVTFTVKDGEELTERVKHLRGAYRSLLDQRRRVLESKHIRRSGTEAAKAIGGLHSVEVKRGSGSGLWHPHIHALWVCDQAPDQFALREEWERATRDSFVVDVRPLHCFEEREGHFFVDREGLGRDMREVVKYSLKFSDMSFEDQYFAACSLRRATRAMRLVGSFGCLWGVGEEVEEVDTLESELDADMRYTDSLWKWSRRSNSYQCKEIADARTNILTGERLEVARSA